MAFANYKNMTSGEVAGADAFDAARHARNDAEYAVHCFAVAVELAEPLIKGGQRDLIPYVLEAYRESIVDEFTDMDVMYGELADEKVTLAANRALQSDGEAA
ncbi:hypothetical protein [Henriciella sp.]|uniref:hypothetical protein n=1 Tax=Henriciella sp. TaxID=1968823 RepID=UPI00260483D4|nr:hypothetical protein [Henriciella sp.]